MDIKSILAKLDNIEEGQTLARPKMPGAGMTPDTPRDVAKKTKKLDLFKSLEEELTETEVLRRISKKFEDFKLSEAAKDVEVKIEGDDEHGYDVYGYVNGEPVGMATFVYDEARRGWYSESTDVDPEYQRMGVATAIYNAAKNKIGRIVPADDQTTDAQALWKGKKMWEQELEEYGGYSGTTGATAQPQTDGNLSDEQKQKAAEIQQTQKTLQSVKPQLQQAGAQNIDVNKMTAALAQADAQPGKQITGQAATELNKLAPGVADALKNPQSAQMLKTALQKGEQAAQQAQQAQKRAWHTQQDLL